MTLNDLKAYLRVDFEDDDEMIRQMAMAAEDYVVGAVGEYNENNSKAKMLFLAVLQDLHDNRTLLVTEQQRRRMSYTYASIILQLQYQTKEEGV